MDSGCGCWALWEVLCAVATGVSVLVWENRLTLKVFIVSGGLFAGALCGMAFGFMEAVAIASWLGEGGCHVAGVNMRAGRRSAVGIGMWPPSASEVL